MGALVFGRQVNGKARHRRHRLHATTTLLHPPRQFDALDADALHVNLSLVWSALYVVHNVALRPLPVGLTGTVRGPL
jgi:hypothetical protein